MNLEIAMDSVMPQSSVLFKDSGLWSFWIDDTEFELKNEPYLTQECSENFSQFINRVIETLIKDEAEAGDPEPLVTIDYAIYNNR